MLTVSCTRCTKTYTYAELLVKLMFVSVDRILAYVFNKVHLLYQTFINYTYACDSIFHQTNIVTDILFSLQWYMTDLTTINVIYYIFDECICLYPLTHVYTNSLIVIF